MKFRTAERRARALQDANAELARHRDHLEERVHERTRELAAARDAAEGANRTKSAFLTNMTHELRTPLHQIMGMADLLGESALDQHARKRLGVIAQASDRLLTIIDGVLDLTRIESRELRIEARDFTLAELFEPIERYFRPIAAGKGLSLVTETDPDLPESLHGDPGRLEQILRLLMDNAIKFSERGRIRLSAWRERLHGGAVTLRFEIQDEGIGLSPEQAAELFQPFYQADDSTRRKYGGTGLGLTLCGRLVALMAGELGVDSRLGQGSTFWVRMRLGIGAAGKPSARRTGPAPRP